MTTNRREEWFQTSGKAPQPIIRVDNTTWAGKVTLKISGIGNNRVTYLTPDEADQLAEMLRLSARDTRALQS